MTVCNNCSSVLFSGPSDGISPVNRAISAPDTTGSSAINNGSMQSEDVGSSNSSLAAAEVDRGRQG